MASANMRAGRSTAMNEQIRNSRRVKIQRPAVTRSRSKSLSRALDQFGDLAGFAFPGLVLFVILVALVCGGGTRQGLWSDALAQIVSLPLLAAAGFRLSA